MLDTVIILSLLLSVFILIFLELTSEKFTSFYENDISTNGTITYLGKNIYHTRDVYGNRTFDESPHYNTPYLNTWIENNAMVRDPYHNKYIDGSIMYTDVYGNTWWNNMMDTTNYKY